MGLTDETPSCVLVHGTRATLEAAIENDGLLEPFPGRGIHLTTNWRYAVVAAEAACIVERATRDAAGPDATALLVYVDAEGMEGYRSRLDVVPSFVVPDVPRGRILRMKRVPITLPGAGSRWERRALSMGFSCTQPGPRAEPALALCRALYGVRGNGSKVARIGADPTQV